MTKRGHTVDPEPYSVGVDLGGTRFRVAALSDDGRILQRVSEATRVHEGRDVVLRRIYDAIRAVIGSQSPRQPVALAVVAPGPLDPWKGVVYNPPNMPGWDEVPLKSLMEQELALRVYVGNDANVAALGEHRYGAGRGLGDLVYITVSTGIGGGVIAGNRLLLGSNGLAGEIGHMTIAADGPLCGCGNHGCLEAIASGTAIANRARAAITEGTASAMLELAGDDVAKINAEMVERAARGGDPLAVRLFKEAAEALGIAIANVVHLFNPQMVVIGGGVSNVGALLFDPVREEVRKRTMASFRKNLQIVRAKLGDDVGLLGCAALVLAEQSHR